MDTTLIKIRSVNEATDRTVSLPVPTAMTASDMATGVYASLAALCVPAQVLAPATELRGSFMKNPKRKLDRAGEPQPSERLGAPPTRLKAPEKATWNEMRESGFWLTTTDQFMVENAAGLMAKHRSGKIDNPARSLFVSTLGFGPTERSKLGFRK